MIAVDLKAALFQGDAEEVAPLVEGDQVVWFAGSLSGGAGGQERFRILGLREVQTDGAGDHANGD